MIASFNFYMRDDSKSPMKAIYSDVQEIKADGPDKVTFTLSAPNADFPYLVSDYKAPIMPASDNGDVDWQSGIRTGAFKLEFVGAGRRRALHAQRQLPLRAAPYFDSCEIRNMPDVTARTNALTTGEIDWMAAPDLKTLTCCSATPTSRSPRSPATPTIRCRC